MTLRSLTVLGLITACALALAIASSHSWNASDAVSERGNSFTPAIVEGAQRVSEITIEELDKKTVLIRNGAEFVDASGFPAKIEPVRELIKSLAALTIVERKTADPDRHHELELAPPEADAGAGKRVVLKSADGTAIESLIIGKADYSVAGGGGGHFVRRESDPQSYLVGGAVKLPFSRAGWFDTAIFDIGEVKIKRASLGDGQSSVLRIERVDDALVIADLPPDLEPNLEKIGRIDRSFVPLKLEDVRKASNRDLSGEPILTFETDTGLTIEVRSVEAIADNNRWAQISAAANKSEADADAQAIEDRVKGFEFRLDTLTSEILSWTREDLTSPRES